MIFAIDTSTETIGMCLFDGTKVISEQIWRSQNHHTIELIPAIKKMLVQSKVHPKELSGLGVALGPGSFTSLRIGLSVIKGMALALNLPVVGIGSLEILAAGQPKLNLPLIAILNLGRGRLASKRFEYQDGWISTSEMLVGDAREIEKTIESPVYICGEMNEQDRQILGRKWKTVQVAPASMNIRRPIILAELTYQRIQNNQVDDVVILSPIYIHTLSDVPDL